MTTQQPATQYERIVPKKPKMAFSRKMFIILMLAYPIIHFLIFWVYINFNTILLSFQKFSYMQGKEVFYGFKNYEKFFMLFTKVTTDDSAKQVVSALLNSLSYFIFNNFILLPVSIFFAYLLFKKVFGEKIFRIIFFLPNIISIVVLSMCFKFMFDSKIGPIDSMLSNLGFTLPANGLFQDGTGGFLTDGGLISTSQIMIFVYCLWAGVGYNVLLLSGSIARIPTEIFEAAKIDGIGMFREFLQMVVPLIMSTVSTLFVTGSMVMFTLYLQPMLFTKGDFDTFTIAFYIVNNVNADQLYYAAAVGIIVSLVGIPLVQGFKWVMEKITPPVEF